MPDPQLDDLLTQSKQDLEKTNQLQGALTYGIAQDPTQQRQVQSTARSLGVAPDIVQQNPKAMQEAAKLNGFDFDAFARTYPITTQIMSNPLTAAASHDDLETYKTLESSFGGSGDASYSYFPGGIAVRHGDAAVWVPSLNKWLNKDASGNFVDAPAGLGQPQMQEWAGAYTANMSPSDRELLYKLKGLPSSTGAALVGSIMQTVYGATGGAIRATRDLLQTKLIGPLSVSSAPSMTLLQQASTALYDRLGVHPATQVADYLGKMATLADQKSEQFAYAPMPITGVRSFSDGVKAGASIVGGVLPYLTPTSAAGKMFATAYGERSKALEKQGTSPDQRSLFAGGAAIPDAIIGAATGGETPVGGHSVVAALLTRPIRTGLAFMAKHYGDQVVNEALGITPIKDPNETLGEWMLRNTVNGGADSFLGGFALSSIGAIPDVVGGQLQARANAKYMGKLADAVKASKMAAEDPQAFQEHLSQLAKGTEVGMPADSFVRYWQAQGEDPTAKAQEMGIDNLNEAAATGTDVQIPIDRFLTATVGTPHFDELAKDIRLTPGAPTLREADAQAQDFADNVKASQAELQKMATTETEHPDREAIFKRIQAEMLAAGGEAAKTADETAKLLTNFSINMAGRASTPEKLISPQEIADRLNIFRAQPGQEGENAAQASNRRAQGPVPGNASADDGSRGLRAQEPADVRAARIAALQGHEPDQVMAHTDRQDFQGLSYDDTTTPRLGLPATVFVNGDHIGVRVDHNGTTAWVTAQVRDGHLYTGTLKQSTREGIPGIGTDLLQTLGKAAVEHFPEVQEGNLYGLAGGTLENPEGIKRVRDRFTNTIWDGDKVSTPIRDLTETDFSKPVALTSDSGDPMGQMFYQPAYHGSPYRFDKFSLEHMGKGEGAQAYGWGLYFAGEKAVAEFYRSQLAIGTQKLRDLASPYQGISDVEAARKLRQASKQAEGHGRKVDAAEYIETALWLESGRPENFGGQLYKVDIPEDSTMLDWGKPLSEQPESVKTALEGVARGQANPDGLDLGGGMVLRDNRDGQAKPESHAPWVLESSDGKKFDLTQADVERMVGKFAVDSANPEGDDYDPSETGQIIYTRLVSQLGSQEAASKYLNSLGIPGIRYLDASSRGAGEGTHNYVIFDDGAVKVLQTYYQSPVFYSALERAVPDMAKIADKSGEVQPEQAKAWLAARQKEGKFKQAELDAIGVNDWLDLQKGKVPVSAVQDFIEQNGVQIREVEKGAPRLPEGLEIKTLPDGAVGAFKDGELIASGVDESDLMTRLRNHRMEGTKYPSYQLPGGQDYRELLLTLPREAAPVVQDTWTEEPARRNLARGGGSYGVVDTKVWRTTMTDGAEADITYNPHTDKYALHVGAPHFVSNAQFPSLEAAKSYIKNGAQGAFKEPVKFRSSHWDEPNILAHIRFNSRTDAEGRKVLFIEEIQSDWGQKGKKEGFDTGAVAKAKAELEAYMQSLYQKYGEPAPGGYADFRDKVTPDEDAKITELNKAARAAVNEGGKVPTAPFVTDTKAWVALSLKRMIRYAADNGFERVAFVNGEQSADRYDLSKQVNMVSVHPEREAGKYQVAIEGTDGQALFRGHDGWSEHGQKSMTAQELEDLVGKEVARHLIEGSDRINKGKAYEDSKWYDSKPEDLKVGGEGMKAFYDKIVPSVANDVLKKLGGGKVDASMVPTEEADAFQVVLPNGKVVYSSDRKASAEAIAKDYDGAKVVPQSGDTQQLGFDITPELKKIVQEGQPLFQPTAGAGGPRGFLEFGPDKKFNLGLLNDDKSTPIHELGHFYLEVLHDLSDQEGTSQQVKDDYGTIRKWLGAEGDAPLTTEQHEQFARAHELYMREGKAPTEGLRGVFQRFGRWLTKIYQTAEQLQVPMTDEVRGVFDRLYASDEEIEQARKAVGDLPMFASAKDMGVTEKEFKAYQKLKEAEITSAKERLLALLTKQNLDEQRAEWREALAQKRDEVAAELDADPAYQALKVLVAGHTEDGTPIKLSREALVERYGEARLKELGRGQGFVYAKEGGMDADAAALLLGHESGDALVNALTGLEPRGKRIAREAEARLKAERGDLMSDESALKAKALEELHSTKREEVLALELKALNRLKRGVNPVVESARNQLTAEQRQEQALRDTISEAQGSAAKAEARKSASEKRSIEQSMPPMRAYRIAASAFVDTMPLSKTDPNKYLLAQRKAGKEAFDLQGKGDYAGAAEAKQQEILNHFMYLEAVRARQDGEKAYQFAQKLQKPQVVAKLAKAGGTYLDQVNALLDRFEFGRVSNAELARRETLAQWVEAQTNMNEEPVIADKLLDESFKVNYRQLTNADLRDLHNALKNIRHLAYRQLEVLVGDRRVAFADLVDQLDSAARANNKVSPLSLPGSTEGAKQKAHDFLAGKDAAMVKIEQMVNWLDGNDVNGPWHEAIWNPIAKAETADYDLITKVTGKLMEALDQMPKEQQNSMADTFDVPGINQPLNRRQLITMLFNMGTDMNRMKLIEGYADYGFTPETVDRALSNLNQHDAAFVQGVWNTIGDLWPQIVDLQKRQTGVDPKREEPLPYTITFKDGTSARLSGGYFPLKAAAGRSTVAGKQESSATALFDYGGGYVKATTMTGHTKERTAAVYPLDLDFTHIIAQHTTQVIKDLTHREAVILANRLLTHPTVRKAMQETMGDAYTGQFMPWLRSIVNDRNGAAAASASAWTNVATATRGNLVAALLGFKFSTVIVQLTDPLRVIGPGDYRVPVPTYTKALLDYMQHPNDVTKMVRELSGEMRHRPENLDRDIRAQWEHLQGDASWRAAWNRKAFHGLGMIDALTSVPSWLGAYRHALASGETPENAVLKADRTVRLTLMSGSPKDLLGVQRDPDKFMKLITMFMGDGPAQYGLLRNAGRKGLKGVPEFTAVAVMMSMANIVGDSLKGQNPAPNEDKAQFYLRKALLAWSQPIPIVRDLANAIDSKLAGKPFSDYRLSPVLAVGQKVVDTAGDAQKLIEGKEAYPDFAIKAFDLLGTLYGVGGTSQAVASAKYLRRVYTGEEKPASAAELVAGAVQGKPKQGVK